ncbi:hypothetical protein YERSI8AC_390008 [Enterobacterales bacterium 8AC]|nr:hypothetical protein YERSI8AC_390008 [Enterobacterales bacterium 8AC]
MHFVFFVEIDEDGYILEQYFKEIMLNDKSVAILYGQHVHLFDVESYEVRSIHPIRPYGYAG